MTDIGGRIPGGNASDSTELYQEGLIIPPTPLTDEVVQLFVANARNPDERRGDLRAQIAAHHLATRRIDELCERRGLPLVEDCAHAHGSSWRGRGVGSWGAFGSFSMQGGKLSVSGSYNDARSDHPLSGTAEISDFRIRNAPALARLLQALRPRCI